MKDSQIRRAHATMNLLVIGAAVRPSTYAAQWHATQLIEEIRRRAKSLARRRVNECNHTWANTDAYRRGTEKIEKALMRDMEFLQLRAPDIVRVELTGALQDCVTLRIRVPVDGDPGFLKTVYL